MVLFPLHRCRRLGGDIVHDAVDARHFVDDARADLGEQIVGQARPIDGHKVVGRYGADGQHKIVRALVAHHADGAGVGQHGEILVDVALKTGQRDFLAQNRVALANGFQLVRRDVAHDADRQTGAGERLTPNHVVRHAQLLADLANLVLEQHAERLHQTAGELRAHIGRQTADVVVRLNHRAALDRAGFDHVRVNRALREEFHALELLGLVGEAVDELAADQLALRLRVGNARQLGQEAVARVHDDQIHRELLGEDLADGFGFVFAHEAVIDVNAGQALADGAGDQRRRDGGIHAAGEAEHHAAVRADLLANGGDGVVDEGAHRPVARAAADVVQEVGDDLLALFAVRDFRVELHRVDALFGVRHRAERAVFAVGDGGEALRRMGDVESVAHPRDGLRLHAGKQRAVDVEIHRDAAVFALGGALDGAAEGVGRQLHAVADAQNRDALLVDGRVDMRRIRVEHGSGAAGEDDAHRLLFKDFGKRRQVGNNLAENLGFAHTAGDQLGILRAEVHQNNSLHILHRMRNLLWL